MSFIRGNQYRLYFYFMFLAALAFLSLAGCAKRATGPKLPAQVKLGFSLESNDLASLVRSVTLTMESPDTVIVQTMPLINGEIHDTLVVQPAPAIIFTLRAFDAGENLLYIGSDTAGVEPGQHVQVSIVMRPNPELLMMRAGPLFQSSAMVTENLVPVFVDIYHVDSLFSAVFRIRYDTLHLRFEHAAEGEFLSESGHVPTISGVLKDTLGYVAYFVSRYRQNEVAMAGISGSGRLATFYFTKIAVGTSGITIDPRTVSLTKPGPEPRYVDHFASLVRDSAIVEIK